MTDKNTDKGVYEGLKVKLDVIKGLTIMFMTLMTPFIIYLAFLHWYQP